MDKIKELITIEDVFKFCMSLLGTNKHTTNKYTGFKICGKMYAEITERQNYISVLVRNKVITQEELNKLDISLTSKDKWTLDSELRIPKEGEAKDYFTIIERAYTITKEEYDEKIKVIINNALISAKDYITKFASIEEYAFEKLLEKWEEFKMYEISNNDLDDLKSDLQALDEYSSESFLNKYIGEAIKYGFVKTMFELIAYIDNNGYGKNQTNLYEDKRTLALTFVRQNKWLENLINYRKYKDLNKVTEVVRNVIMYILNPEKALTIFKLDKIKNFYKYVKPGFPIENTYEGLCHEIYDYLSYLDINIENEMNRGIIYARLIFVGELYEKWDIANMYWKIQPYKEKTLSKDCIKENLNNNFIITSEKKISQKATYNIFYMEEENSQITLAAFMEAAEETEEGIYRRRFKKLANTEKNIKTLPSNRSWGSKPSSKQIIKVKDDEKNEFEEMVIYNMFQQDLDEIIENIKNEPHEVKPIEDDEPKIYVDDDDVVEESDIETPLNMILYGPPGTGKTYNTINYAVSIVEKSEIDDVVNGSAVNREAVFKRYKKYLAEKKIVFTTFHQNYSYEEFIQGIRANTNNTDSLSFVKEDGIFKDLVERAKVDSKSNYVIIIDEINRGNISRIFGELITLIEEDKRLGNSNEMMVTLPSKEVFGVPSNIYIVGTMNTADKSIALIDIALRRRFDFIPMYPDYKVIPEFESILRPINEAIYMKKKSADYLIGHGFFAGKTLVDIENLVNKKLIPLLSEYFYSNPGEVKDILLKGGIETEMDMNTYQLKYTGIEE